MPIKANSSIHRGPTVSIASAAVCSPFRTGNPFSLHLRPPKKRCLPKMEPLSFFLTCCQLGISTRSLPCCASLVSQAFAVFHFRRDDGKSWLRDRLLSQGGVSRASESIL